MLFAASQLADQVDRAFVLIGGICLILFLGITATLIVFTIRYHRSRTRTAAQIKVNYGLEIAWTVLPTILVTVMFYIGYKPFKFARAVPADARVVNVIAQQWVWSFVYPEHNITDHRAVVPANRPVKFELKSLDVVHSFYLPAFRVKEDAVPGRTNYLWINPDKPGRYSIFCAEFCGKDHALMLSELIVLSDNDYQTWIEQKMADKNKPIIIDQAMNPTADEIVRRDGAAMFKTYCASCHGEDGRGGLIEGARNFTQLADWTRTPRITDIFRTVTDGLEGTHMRSYRHLPAWDRFALAHYVAGFYTGPDRPVDTREQITQLVADYQLDKQPTVKKQIPIDQAMRVIAHEAHPQTR